MSVGAPTGNTNSARGKEWTQAIKRALARRGEGDFRRGLDLLADKVLAKSEEGDTAAWQEVANRFDGKPAQTTILQGDEDGGPVQIAAIERRIIDANTDA